MTQAKMVMVLQLTCLLLGCGSSSSGEAADDDVGDSEGVGDAGTSGETSAETDPEGNDPSGDAFGSSAAGDAPGLSDFVGASADDDCVQAEHFLLGLSADPANADYAAPVLDVACSDTQVTVMSNNIPSFEYLAKTPNALVEMDMTYHFPRFPTQAASTTEVPLGGTVAVAVNGLAIFGPTEAPAMGYRDPYLDGLLDFCNGHTAPGGMYHFHARPDCLFEDLDGNVRLVVAYAFDGFPILAPYACSVEGECTQTDELRSSYQRVAGKWSGDTPNYDGTTQGSWDLHEYVAGSGDLDECNGKELPGGGYAYYATDSFPYFLGCYRGTPTSNTHGH